MLAIAYHNLGVEEDHCGNLENAKQAYYKAFEMVERINGPDDPLAKKFKQAYVDAKNVTNPIRHFLSLSYLEMHSLTTSQ